MADVTITASAYGRRVGLIVEHDRLPDLREWLPFWWQDADVEPERVWRVEGYAQTVGDLELWLAEHAVEFIFVHAAVVAFDGVAIVVPGRSMTGKSTLCKALLECGADYGSDEYAVIDAAGLVHPYPRPLSLRQPDGTVRRVDFSQYRADVMAPATPIGVVAAMRFDPAVADSSVECELCPASPAETVLHLLDNTVAAQSRSAEAADVLVKVVNAASATRAGVRADAATAADLLRKLLD